MAIAEYNIGVDQSGAMVFAHATGKPVQHIQYVVPRAEFDLYRLSDYSKFAFMLPAAPRPLTQEEQRILADALRSSSELMYVF